MRISARVQNRRGEHGIELTTGDRTHSIQISPQPTTGLGSSANGGELLFLALATCYCNDIYREAAKRHIAVESVEVDVTGGFGAPGEPARNISYGAKVAARAPQEVIRELMEQTDRVAEVHNTLRLGIPVNLSRIEPVVL